MLAHVTEGKSYRWRDQIRDTMRALGPEDTQPMPRIPLEPPPIPPDLVELLRALGVALLNSADSAATTTETLQDVAAAYDVDAQAMVMPTGILFRVGPDEVDLVSVPNRSLRLDQIAQVNKLVALLQRAAITPSLGLRRLHQILTAEPRFGPWMAVVGQVILSLGFGLLLNPDLLALPFYAALGAFVGVLRLIAEKWATLSVALPVIAAFLVTVLAVKVVAPFVHDDPIRLVAPALVTFLPGATLTIATIEGNLVTPYVMGRSLTLNPVIILISLTFWGWMWGVVGIILAVPILAAFKIFCAHIEEMEPVAEFLS
jgi:uncharacterized membrane protein YjjP (DUF1212 family)